MRNAFYFLGKKVFIAKLGRGPESAFRSLKTLKPTKMRTHVESKEEMNLKPPNLNFIVYFDDFMQKYAYPGVFHS